MTGLSLNEKIWGDIKRDINSFIYLAINKCPDLIKLTTLGLSPPFDKYFTVIIQFSFSVYK